MAEIWKDIQGYEGLYQVSNLGRIKSLERVVSFGKQRRLVKEKIRVQKYDKKGYCTVTLSKDNKIKHAKVHRVVAEAFIPNPLGLKEINHIDENKENNCVDNLEWCTHYENVMHGTKRERQVLTRSKRVVQCDMEGKEIKTYISATHAEKEIVGKFTGNIYSCLEGRTKTAYGYIWKYKEAD